jgi:dienelactone hydrolase
VAKFFEERGIEPKHVEIDWKKDDPKKFSGYAQQFLDVYKKQKGTEVYVLGFSFGATTAFITASKTKPKALILCSLSPYFKEDLGTLNPKWVKWFRKNFVESEYSFSKFAPKIKNKTYLIVGDQEGEFIFTRARDAKKKLQDSHLFVAKGAKHNIGQKEYLEAVKRVILKL